MRLNKDKFNYYGLRHEKVRERFGDLNGNLEYVGTFTVHDEYMPSAVYYSPNPDTSKGHKNYLLIVIDHVLLRTYVRGMTIDEMKVWRHQEGRYCANCDELLYSTMQHDARYCTCRSVFIDGGRVYTHASVVGAPVTIDLLTGIPLES